MLKQLKEVFYVKKGENILSIDSQNNLRFLRDNDQVAFIVLGVAEETVVVDLHLSGLVAELQSQLYVLGKGLRFLLCKGRHDGQKNFALGIHRINIFFLEVHGNVLFFQLTDVFQAIQRIAGESADGLGNDHVDLGCHLVQAEQKGLRRKRERNLKINARLEEVLLDISSQMTAEEIEKRSRVQKRGRFSDPVEISLNEEDINKATVDSTKSTSSESKQLSLFDVFPQD